MGKWFPVDGDIFVTSENFVFYAFGYDHPRDCVFSFLKYVPSKFEALFPLRFLAKHWMLGGQELLRAERLYTQQNYRILLETFRSHFPHYLHSSSCLGKEVIGAPLDYIKDVFVPRECFQRLLGSRKMDHLQKKAVELTRLLAETSGVNSDNFGIHGSIALNMHTVQSDIDLVVYGANNFRIVERTISKLADEGIVTYILTRRSDRLRKYRGKFGNQRFVYTAIRNFEEISSHYGEYRYLSIKPLVFSCKVVGDDEGMFRPAIYHIVNYEPLDSSSEIENENVPIKVVSMLGCYRNMARVGDALKVSGMLERVEKMETGEIHHQVVVGTTTWKEEYLWPI